MRLDRSSPSGATIDLVVPNRRPTHERDAIETWCFAPSVSPDGQNPLVL